MSERVFATAEDFMRAMREALEDEMRQGKPETIPLPSKGLIVSLRHPGPVGAQTFLRLHDQVWSAFKEEKNQNETLAPAERKFDASMAYQDFLDRVFSAIFVRPSYGSRPGEIGLRDILLPDLAFIFRWLGGEIVSRPDGAVDDLKPFPGGSGVAERAGVDSEREPLQAKCTTGAAGNGSISD
jgi:hypothetical protein